MSQPPWARVRAGSRRHVDRVDTDRAGERRRRASTRGDDRFRRVPDRLPAQRAQPDRPRSLPDVRVASRPTRPGSRTPPRPSTRPACVSRDLHEPDIVALRQAHLRQDPNNLFTLLGRRYRIEDGEEATSFCPKRLCPNVRPQTSRLDPGASWTWAGRSASWPGLERFKRRRDARRSTSSTCCFRIALGVPALGAHLLRRAERKRHAWDALDVNPVAHPAEVSATPAAARVHRSPARTVRSTGSRRPGSMTAR